MDDQLNAAPCGYFVMQDDWKIIKMNQTLKDMMKNEESPSHIHDMLTVPSRIYFQTYFPPAIAVHKKVREMYLNLKVEGRSVPVLLNANERNGLLECIIVQIKTRDEYENQLMTAKKNAERIQKETDVAYTKLLGILQEVEDKQQQLLKLNSELEKLAARDELTGLHNRRIFQIDLAAAIENAEENGGQSFSVLLLDIDHFKNVNDTYGHATGDLVLKELARKMESAVLPPHTIARIGGEEFAILLQEPFPEKAIEKAEELRKFLLSAKWEILPITVSMGITHYQNGDTPNSLYIRADDALYASKRNGRNRLTIQ